MDCQNCKLKPICYSYKNALNISTHAKVEITACIYCNSECREYTVSQKAHNCTNTKDNSPSNQEVNHIQDMVSSLLTNTSEEPLFVPAPIKNTPMPDNEHCYICGAPKTANCNICGKPICDNHQMNLVQNGKDLKTLCVCEECFDRTPHVK